MLSVMRRIPPFLLADGMVVPHAFPVVLGWDVAGVVDEVRGGGPFRRGDDVVAFTRSMPVAAGALADYVAVGATAVARKPASLGWTEAAVLPLAGLMADQLVEALDGAARQRVLVLGAAGGVGTFTTQLLAARGAEVLGTASADEFGHLREFGVGVPLDRTRPLAGQLAGSGRPGAIDAVVDLVGGPALAAATRLLRPGGLVVSSMQPPQAVLGPDAAPDTVRALRGGAGGACKTAVEMR